MQEKKKTKKKKLLKIRLISFPPPPELSKKEWRGGNEKENFSFLFSFETKPLFFVQPNVNKKNKTKTKTKRTTFNGGSLGSCIDEERSKMRYVMWIAEFRESSNFRTQIALVY